MSSPAMSGALGRIAPALRPHLPGLIDRTVVRVLDIDSYRDDPPLTRDQIQVIVRDNFEYLLEHEPGAEDVPMSPPRETGRLHARHGIPLADVLSAYRVGFALLWEMITQVLSENDIVETRQVIEAATEMWWRADHFGQAVTEAYRDATTEIMLRQEHERSAMVEALVTGTVVEQSVLWDTASRLGIPHHGHFLVVAAAAVPLGADPLPGIVSGLRKVDVASAWRLTPHQAVGVLSLPEPDPSRTVECLHAHATGQVGLSPVFAHLDATPRAYYLAGVALRSRPHPYVQVRQFDDTPVATLVAAAPDAAAAIARNVLGPILELPPHDRDTLLDTFEAWLQCRGSLTETGARVYCHPNTVRYRLRKLAEHSGRALDDPAATGELNAALQAWRLIGDEHAPGR